MCALVERTLRGVIDLSDDALFDKHVDALLRRQIGPEAAAAIASNTSRLATEVSAPDSPLLVSFSVTPLAAGGSAAAFGYFIFYGRFPA